MKISYSKIEDFLQKLQQPRTILLYGNDYGTVSLFVSRITDAINTYQSKAMVKISLDFSLLNNDPSPLLLFNNNISLFAEEQVSKIIHITDAQDTISSKLLSSLKRKQFHHIILSGHKIKSKSAIVSNFDKSENLFSIPCYKDNCTSEIIKLLAVFSNQYGISYTSDAKHILISYLTENPHAIQSTLEKIRLWFNGGNYICDFNVANSCTNNSFNAELDDLCIKIADGNVEEALNLLENINAPVITIIRTIARYFARLEQVSRQIQDGTDIETAMKVLSTPVFFKNVPHFHRHVRKFPHYYLLKQIRKFVEMEIICKKTTNKDLILKQYICLQRAC